MKIGPLDSKPIAAPAQTERKGPSTAAGGNKAEASAQVDLSHTASLLSGVSTDATFDTQKVDRISQAIRDGKFKVNPEAIASKLIINAQELLGRQFS